MTIDAGDVLTPDGCARMLDSLRMWLHDNVSFTNFDFIESESDHVNLEDNPPWTLLGKDVHFLAGVSTGLIVAQRALTPLSNPISGLLNKNYLETCLAAYLLKTVKRAITAHQYAEKKS